MLQIKNTYVKYVNSFADFQLEDGTLLFEKDWNGIVYRNGWKNEQNTNNEYKPIYKYEKEGIDLYTLEENSDEWDSAMKVIGFDIL